MVPFVLLLLLVLVAWAFARDSRGAAPYDLCVVLRVRDASDTIEALLRAAQCAGIGRVIVADEGSSDLTQAIVSAWARTHPGASVSSGIDFGDLPAAALVLDARRTETAWEAARVLRWLGSGESRMPTGTALR